MVRRTKQRSYLKTRHFYSGDMPAQRLCAAKNRIRRLGTHHKNAKHREGCLKISFMYTTICKTHGATHSRPNRLRVATLFFGHVSGASVLTRFADRAKKQPSIFLGVLKREEEILLRRYDAKIWCEGLMRRSDAKVRRSEDPQRKLSGIKESRVQAQACPETRMKKYNNASQTDLETI